MRVLGVDLGRRRIGLAISDPEANFAFPLAAIASGGPTKDIATLGKLMTEHEVARVVLGLPLHMDGRAGPEAEAARSFARALERATGVPVETLDERWTSVQAERTLRESGTPKRRRESRRRGDLDSMAATIVLRTWLERDAHLRDTDESP
jgi:putative Holliday junction resolvase